MRLAVTFPRSVAVLLAALLTTARVVSAAPALRVPQIPISGTALTDRLYTYSEYLDVQTAQVDFQSWPATAFRICGFSLQPTFEVDLSGNAAHNSYGLYLAAAPATRAQLFPAEAGDGWMAIYKFRSSPNRLVVSLFNDQAAFLGNTTYPGLLPSDVLSFYVQTSSETLYGEDARNPNGDAQMLVFPGTGINGMTWWFAWEDQPLQSSDHDFADAILWVQILGDCGDAVERSTWGQVKARFR